MLQVHKAKWMLLNNKHMYLINNDIIFFDDRLVAFREIVFQNIHDSVQKFNDEERRNCNNNLKYAHCCFIKRNYDIKNLKADFVYCCLSVRNRANNKVFFLTTFGHANSDKVQLLSVNVDEIVMRCGDHWGYILG